MPDRPACPRVAADVLIYHRELRARIEHLDATQLAAHEAGRADAWGFERGEATALLGTLEHHYPHLAA